MTTSDPFGGIAKALQLERGNRVVILSSHGHSYEGTVHLLVMSPEGMVGVSLVDWNVLDDRDEPSRGPLFIPWHAVQAVERASD